METDDKKLRKKRNRQRFNRSCFAETTIEFAPFEKEKNVSDCSFSSKKKKETIKQKVFNCNECKQYFNTKLDLRLHMTKAHLKI